MAAQETQFIQIFGEPFSLTNCQILNLVTMQFLCSEFLTVSHKSISLVNLKVNISLTFVMCS